MRFWNFSKIYLIKKFFKNFDFSFFCWSQAMEGWLKAMDGYLPSNITPVSSCKCWVALNHMFKNSLSWLLTAHQGSFDIILGGCFLDDWSFYDWCHFCISGIMSGGNYSYVIIHDAIETTIGFQAKVEVVSLASSRLVDIRNERSI